MGIWGIIGLIGLVLSIVGWLSSVWYIYEKLVPIRRLSWRSAQKAALKIASEIVRDGFSTMLYLYGLFSTFNRNSSIPNKSIWAV